MRKPFEVPAHIKAYSVNKTSETEMLSADGLIQLPETVGSFDIMLEIPGQ